MTWLLLRRTPDRHPELAPLVLLGGLAVAALIAVLPWQGLATSSWPGRGGRRMAAAVAGAGLLVALLRQDADRYTWVAAAVGSNSAAGVQLAEAHRALEGRKTTGSTVLLPG